MGPLGQGPQTGRGLGFCSGSATPGAAAAGGRGFGGGRGQGRGGGGGRGRGRHGNRNMFYATGLTGWQRAAAEEPAAPASGTAPAADPTRPAPPPEKQTDTAELSNVLQQIQDRLAALEGKVEQPVTTEAPNA